MRTKQFKLFALILFVCISINAQNQNHRKTYNEEFDTNKDVVIEINTRNTDVQIETWNKNKVSVEAIIEIEGVDSDKADKTLENWVFKAIGNKSEIEVSSKSSSMSNYLFSSNGENNIIINGQQHHDLEFDFDFPKIELDNLHSFNNDIMFFPEAPEAPMYFNYNYDFERTLPRFDYEKYKKDKNYLKKWQKEMEENLEKNKNRFERNDEKLKEHDAVLKVELEKMEEKRIKMMEKQLEQRKEHAKIREKQIVLRKEQIAKHRADVDKKRNIIISVLEDREKIKVKRIIIIKAPKDAKFKMNVKYGTLSFPK